VEITDHSLTYLAWKNTQCGVTKTVSATVDIAGCYA